MSLQVQGLVKHFGGVKAVDGVTFTVEPGECVALIGPNGAGKSTTFACIAGQHPLTAGQVLWNGERIDALRPAQRLQRGIARTFQVAQTFEALTVLQNVQLLTQYPRGLAAYLSYILALEPSAAAPTIMAAAASTETLGVSWRTHKSARVDNSGVRKDSTPICRASPCLSAASHR